MKEINNFHRLNTFSSTLNITIATFPVIIPKIHTFYVPHNIPSETSLIAARQAVGGTQQNTVVSLLSSSATDCTAFVVVVRHEKGPFSALFNY